jgi:hypothetical protein
MPKAKNIYKTPILRKYSWKNRHGWKAEKIFHWKAANKKYSEWDPNYTGVRQRDGRSGRVSSLYKDST